MEYPKGRDKVTEVLDILTYIENGLVYLDRDANWLEDFRNECAAFNAEMTHKHDDQVDTLVMAIKCMLAKILSLYDYY